MVTYSCLEGVFPLGEVDVSLPLLLGLQVLLVLFSRAEDQPSWHAK